MLDNVPSAGGTAAFGTDPQARLDYGCRAVGEVTPVVKAFVRAYQCLSEKLYGTVNELRFKAGCWFGGTAIVRCRLCSLRCYLILFSS